MGINRQSVQLHKILVDVLQQRAESHISYTPSSAHGLQQMIFNMILSPKFSVDLSCALDNLTGLARFAQLFRWEAPRAASAMTLICDQPVTGTSHVYEISISQIKLHIETWTKKKQLSSTERSER